MGKQRYNMTVRDSRTLFLIAIVPLTPPRVPQTLEDYADYHYVN